MSLQGRKNADMVVCVGTSTYDPRKARIEATENRNYKRAQELQLQRQLDQDIEGGAVSAWLTTDGRRNAYVYDEDWALGNQLAHGPRLTPHRS